MKPFGPVLALAPSSGYDCAGWPFPSAWRAPMEKKRQHLIPNCYLKAWCDPVTPPGHTLSIWRISMDGATKKRKSPDKSFTSTDRYTVTLPSGERSLVREDTLSALEGKFVPVLSRIRRRESLNVMDRAHLCMFTAAMHSRTMVQGEHWRKQIAKLHEQIEALERARGAPPETSLATGRMVSTAHLDIVLMGITQMSPLLFQMRMSILVTDDDTGFITSDVPCLLFNPKLHTLPPSYRSPGLAQCDIEVRLPLTPQHMLVISHQELEPYISVNSKMVQELNRTTRFSCHAEFISWKGIVDPFWFSEREMPDDAWEKTEQGKAAMAEAEEWEATLERLQSDKPKEL